VNKAITLVLFCIFLLYPWITLQLLQFGICLHLDSKYYLVADMGQLCFEGAWMDHLGAVITLFLLLSLGIPAVLGHNKSLRKCAVSTPCIVCMYVFCVFCVFCVSVCVCVCVCVCARVCVLCTIEIHVFICVLMGNRRNFAVS